jgi:hypothetical protein
MEGYKQTTGAVRSVRIHGIRFGCYECALFLNIPTVLSKGRIYIAINRNITPETHFRVRVRSFKFGAHTLLNYFH